MSSKHEISLLPQEEFEQKPWGRFLIWVLSVGRWIVVFTEFIVICAFLSRFYFDRQIADLHDDISQKQAIVMAMSDFEEDFRFLQKRMKTIEELTEGTAPNKFLTIIASVLPNDVSLVDFDFDEEDGLEISAIAFSYRGFNDFWHGFDNLTDFENVKISETTRKEGELGIQFTATAELPGGGENAIEF